MHSKTVLTKTIQNKIIIKLKLTFEMLPKHLMEIKYICMHVCLNLIYFNLIKCGLFVLFMSLTRGHTLKKLSFQGRGSC